MMMARSLVGKNTVIGSHAFIGAGATVAGNCRIGEQSFIGINCVVFDATTVGKKCICGACSNVKRNLPDCSSIKSTSELNIKQYREDEVESKLMWQRNVR